MVTNQTVQTGDFLYMTNMKKIKPRGIHGEMGLENDWYRVSTTQSAPKKKPRSAGLVQMVLIPRVELGTSPLPRVRSTN